MVGINELSHDETAICLNYVISRERDNQKTLGLENCLQRFGSKPYHLMLRFFNKLGVFGLILLYTFHSTKRPKKSVDIYNKKILILDHKNRLIRERLLRTHENSSCVSLESLTVRIPLKKFFESKQIKIILQNYSKIKPISMLEFRSIACFWYYYIIAKYVYKFQLLRSVLLVDDFSPLRMAFSLAAVEQKMRIGLVRISDEINRKTPILPFDIFFCWNKKQIEELKVDVKIISHIQQEIQIMQPIRKNKPNKLNVGIALSSTSDKNIFISFLKGIEKYQFSSIKLRPHPKLNTSGWKIENDRVLFCQKGETVSDFLKNVDFVFCGNSSLIVEILFRGVPVCYTSKLDLSPYDIYGYVESGIVLDLNDSDFSIEKISGFYANPDWIKKLNARSVIDLQAIPTEKALDFL
jgi:hypothetical protein